MIPEGEIPLTPSQQWFLKQEFYGQDYWNQSQLFSLGQDLDVERLRAALQKVAEIHDVFRIRFQRQPDATWRQYYSSRQPEIPLEAVDGTRLRGKGFDKSRDKDRPKQSYTFEARPPRAEKPIDPDNPFAALLALKSKM